MPTAMAKTMRTTTTDVTAHSTTMTKETLSTGAIAVPLVSRLGAHGVGHAGDEEGNDKGGGIDRMVGVVTSAGPE